jgi:protein-tyrosine-phosphatase
VNPVAAALTSLDKFQQENGKTLSMKITFVCTGNTCRSPMAEAYFKHLCEKAGLDVEIGSAGTFAGLGEPASINSVQTMAQFNIDLSGFGSTPLTRELIDTSDMIICMTSSHRFQIASMHASALSKTHLLGDFANASGDIADPYGAPLTVYQDCFAEMKPLLENLLHRVASKITS